MTTQEENKFKVESTILVHLCHRNRIGRRMIKLPKRVNLKHLEAIKKSISILEVNLNHNHLVIMILYIFIT